MGKLRATAAPRGCGRHAQIVEVAHSEGWLVGDDRRGRRTKAPAHGVDARRSRVRHPRAVAVEGDACPEIPEGAGVGRGDGAPVLRAEMIRQRDDHGVAGVTHGHPSGAAHSAEGAARRQRFALDLDPQILGN